MKSIKLASLYILSLVLVSFYSCENEPIDPDFQNQSPDTNLDCPVATQAYALAIANFFAWDGEDDVVYSSLCADYATALQGMIDNCGDPNGGLQTILTTLGDCSAPIDPDSCENAIIVVAVAENNLSNATADLYTQYCNGYVSALQEQIEICGDPSGEIQAVINGVGDCSQSTSNEDIEGTWLLTAWNGEEPIDLNNDGAESANFLDEIDCYTNETIVFNTDNTGVVMSTSYATFNFEIETGTTDSYIYTVTCDQEVENSNFTWTQTGNTISITDTATTDVSEWTVNGNQLSTFVPSGFIAFNSDDITVTVSQDLTFVYTKQ